MAKKTPRPVRVARNQESIIRHFIVACDDHQIPIKGGTLADLYQILGYQVAPNGARVAIGTEITMKYGQELNIKDEFYDDWQDITDAEVGTEPCASESTEGSEVREAVLREEV